MKRIFNPIWRFLTTVRIYAQSHDTLERAWKNEYQPFGYERKYPIYEKQGWFILEVCKNIK